MQFKGTHQSLERNRYFYTVWVALPEESKAYIRDSLEAIVPYCEWVSTFADNHSKDIPHITLRYLGFADELDIDDVKSDVNLFKNAIHSVDDMKIELNDITIWKRLVDNKVVNARLNWKITKPEPFINLHNELIKIPNYFLFESLEKENYCPHISLGSVNLSKDSNLVEVEKYLKEKAFKPVQFILKDFALNLTSQEHSEVIPL